MKAGKLRHAIYVLASTDVRTVKGDRVRTFEAVPTAFDPNAVGGVQAATYRPPDDYASIEPLRGRELVVAQGMRGDLTHKVTLRYRPGVNQVARLAWVESDGTGPPPDAYRVHIIELGPEVNDEYRNVEMQFYGYEVR